MYTHFLSSHVQSPSIEIRQRKFPLSHDVASGSEITQCNKIDFGKGYDVHNKPCVHNDKVITFLLKKLDFKVNLMSYVTSHEILGPNEVPGRN